MFKFPIITEQHVFFQENIRTLYLFHSFMLKALNYFFN